MNTKVTTGQSAPLGATIADGGVNFSIYSRHASGVDLLFLTRKMTTSRHE